MTFDEVKSEYERQREEQRKLLSDFLSQHDGIKNAGLRVAKKGGKGDQGYTSGGVIAAYDLRNWKWVCVKNGDKDFDCTISLNMPNLDPGSGNFHALFDRIGMIITYHHHLDFHRNSIVTDIDLPFDNDKMDRIAQLVLEQYRIRSVNN